MNLQLLSHAIKQNFFSLTGHTKSVQALAVLPDGRLASAGDDNTIRLWDVQRRNCVEELPGHTSTVRALAVLPDGRLASAGDDRTIRLWDVQRGDCVKELTAHTNSWHVSIDALAVLPDGRLASAGNDNTIRLWDVQRGNCVKELTGHTKSVQALAVLPDGRLASAGYDNTIRLWDVQRDVCVKTLTGHTSAVRALAVLPDGRLASAGDDRTIRLWDVQRGDCVKELTAHTKPWHVSIDALAVLPDGRLASAGEDHTIRLWDVQRGNCVKELPGHTSTVRALAVLPDGRLASTGYNNTILLSVCYDINELIESVFEALTNGNLAYTQQQLTTTLQSCVQVNYQQQFGAVDRVTICLEQLGNFLYDQAEILQTKQTAHQLAPKVQRKICKKYLADSLLAFTLLTVNDSKLASLLYHIVNSSLLQREFKDSQDLTAATSAAYYAELDEYQQQRVVGIASQLLGRHYELINPSDQTGYFKALETLREKSWLAGLPVLTFYQIAAALAVQQDFCSLQVYENLNHVAAYLAIVADNVELLKELQGLQPALLTQPMQGWTPGLQAARHGSEKALYWLLAHTDNSIHDCGPAQQSIWEVLKKHTSLEQKLSIDASKTTEKALAYAAENKLEPVQQLYYMFEFDINQAKKDETTSQAEEGETLLLAFARHQNLAALQWLELYDVDYAAQDSAGKTASIIAGELSWKEGVQFLHAKACPGACLAHEAVKCGNLQLLKFALETANLDVNTRLITSDDTALHLSVAHDQLELFQYLLQRQADVNLPNKQCDTALLLIIKQNRQAMLPLLLALRPDVNCQDSNGDTPILLIVKQEQQAMLPLLLALQPDVNCQDSNGDTPVILTVKQNQQAMMVQLLQQRADVNQKNKGGETAIDIAMKLKYPQLTAILHLFSNPALLQLMQPVLSDSANLQQFGLFASAATFQPSQTQEPELVIPKPSL